MRWNFAKARVAKSFEVPPGMMVDEMNNPVAFGWEWISAEGAKVIKFFLIFFHCFPFHFRQSARGNKKMAFSIALIPLPFGKGSWVNILPL